jgi:hypothetical protein
MHGGDALGIAAAIRALVEQTLPWEELRPPYTERVWPERERARRELNSATWARREVLTKQLAIAAELDGGNTTTETTND